MALTDAAIKNAKPCSKTFRLSNVAAFEKLVPDLCRDCALNFDSPPGRHALLDKLRGHVVAKGLLIGTYERS